ncbi:SARP family transcriptional regulator [Micromonospora orduensis]|uniref:SARP family transcriptional regulator n=1 Tax=Micromonospora orduensis TaxID=1420891 RepID=A0A5C4QYJ7_9ACTN|nr:BTAD domain-containing putative transcriptional regulator [Micromonospora orduensis]TNH31090.1 SARP family transcriptional regulator [Micromonospora orduensis]
MEIRVLGPVEVWTDGRLVDAGAARQRAVLAALAVDVGRPVHVESLVDRVWGDASPPRVRHNLHVYLARLRRVLADAGAPDALIRRSGGYLLDLPPETVDGRHFDVLRRRADGLADTDPERVDLLRRALELWRGEPLAGLPGDWAARVRQDWHRRHTDTTVRWARALVRRGEPEVVIDPLTRLAADHPLDEPVAAVLLHALATAGRSAQALASYAQLRDRLADTLGADPGVELRQLHQAILRGEITVPAADVSPVAAGHVGRPEPARPVPAQLPSDVRGFAGRGPELARLDALRSSAEAHPGAVPVAVLSGPAGVGKTALAVHWAHRVAGHFPDGQLHANLTGYSPSGVVRSAEQVIRGFLAALGVPPREVPPDEQAQSALYRSLLAGRRMLVLLDNARDAAQVRPLLPGSARCLVLVTSRDRLTGLVATEGAEPVVLDLLTAEDAQALLHARIGARAGAERNAVDELVRLCDRLPLALVVVAARAVVRPHLSLTELGTQLRTDGGLDGLDTGDHDSSVRAALSWSYRLLPVPTARLFRLVGGCTDVTVSTAAGVSLAGAGRRDVQVAFAELADAHLVLERGPDRFAMHDLLRAFAAELSAEHDPAGDRSEARGRLFGHYLHSAHGAAVLLHPHWDPISLAPAASGVRPEKFSDHDEAVAWFTRERDVLIALVERCAASGFDRYAWQLAWSLTSFLDRQGGWHDQLAVQRTALAAARRSGDPDGQAHAHRSLARAQARLGRLDEAPGQLRRALELFGALDDRANQGHTCLDLAEMADRQGRRAEVVEHAEAALSFYRAAGHRYGQAMALNAIGWYRAQLGAHDAAVQACEQGLELLREFDDRHGQAATWDTLGYAQHRAGRPAEAVGAYRHAVDLYRDFRDRYYEADTLGHLAEAQLDAGDPAGATGSWRTALEILDDLGHPDAERIRQRLATAEGT